MTRIETKNVQGQLRTYLSELGRRVFPMKKFGFAYPFARAELEMTRNQLFMRSSVEDGNYFDCQIATELAAKHLAETGIASKIERKQFTSPYCCPMDFSAVVHSFLLVDGRFAFGFTPYDIVLGFYYGKELKEGDVLFRVGSNRTPDYSHIDLPVKLAESTTDLERIETFPLKGYILRGHKGIMISYLGVAFNNVQVAIKFGVEFISFDRKYTQGYLIPRLGNRFFVFVLSFDELFRLQGLSNLPNFDQALTDLKAQASDNYDFNNERVEKAGKRILECQWQQSVLPFVRRFPVNKS